VAVFRLIQILWGIEIAETEPEPENKEDTSPSSDAQNMNKEEDDEDDEDDREGTSIVPIIIAVCLLILVGGLVLIMGLHYKRKLPASFYNVFSPRWKPVNTEDLVEKDEEDRHPSIIKNGGLDETALTEAGEVNVNNDLTTVTWTSDEKEDLKKEEQKVEEQKVEEEKKDEKKDDEKKEEEQKDEEKNDKEEEKTVEAEGEEAPLKPEEN